MVLLTSCSTSSFSC